MKIYRIGMENDYNSIHSWIIDQAQDDFELKFFTQSEDSDYIHYTAVMEKEDK